MATDRPGQPALFSHASSWLYDADGQLTRETICALMPLDMQYDAEGNIEPPHRTLTLGRYNVRNQWFNTDATGQIIGGFHYDPLGFPWEWNGWNVSFDERGGLRHIASSWDIDYTGDGLRAWQGPALGDIYSRTYYLYDG